MKKILAVLIIFSISVNCYTVKKIFCEEYSSQEIENHSETIAIFPFKNDDCGAIDVIIDNFIQKGYEVVMQDKVSSQYEAIKQGKKINADYIILGTIYIAPAVDKDKPKKIGHDMPDVLRSILLPGYLERRKKQIEDAKYEKCIYANFKWNKVKTGKTERVTADFFIRKQYSERHKIDIDLNKQDK